MKANQLINVNQLLKRKNEIEHELQIKIESNVENLLSELEEINYLLLELET